MTPVIFRKFRDGEVIALLPSLAGGRCGECQSYLHVGQHGAADYGHVIRTTRLARPEDHADLQAELVQVGYDDLKVYQREQSWMHRARVDTCQEAMRPPGDSHGHQWPAPHDVPRGNPERVAADRTDPRAE